MVCCAAEFWQSDCMETEGICVEFAIEETGTTDGERVGAAVEDSGVVCRESPDNSSTELPEDSAANDAKELLTGRDSTETEVVCAEFGVEETGTTGGE